jgi:hypothetical protein
VPDVVSAVRAFFAGAAEHVRETDYADACPIATIALEVSSSSEPVRVACAEVFESWIAAGSARFIAAGLSEPTARELAIAMFSALEGGSCRRGPRAAPRPWTSPASSPPPR